MPHTQSQDGLQEEVVVQAGPTHGEPVYIRGVPPWIATLLTVGGLIIAAVLLSLVVDRNGGTEPEPEPEAEATPTPAEPTVAPAPATGGTVLAGQDPILPIPAAGLAPYATRTIRGDAVPVQSVVADEGFWVGTSETDRLYVVYLTGGLESPPDIDIGQRVTFVGWLEGSTAEVNAPQFRLTEAEGLGQVLAQGYFIQTNSVEIVVDAAEEAG